MMMLGITIRSERIARALDGAICSHSLVGGVRVYARHCKLHRTAATWLAAAECPVFVVYAQVARRNSCDVADSSANQHHRSMFLRA